ncbi:MAG: GxxExxY protein [Candidatus Marinimicrobia bacterium]|nr:GxxExxY protein [Candidatus Neomarinimicrobiota bacterium]
MSLGKEIEQLARNVIGAAIEVHRALGAGFLESVYEEALCIELDHKNIPYQRQYPIAVNYRDRSVGEGRLDLLVGEKLIVELKAIEAIAPIHMAQVISYLKTTGFNLALLINFNVRVLKDGIKRIILD